MVVHVGKMVAAVAHHGDAHHSHAAVQKADPAMLTKAAMRLQLSWRALSRVMKARTEMARRQRLRLKVKHRFKELSLYAVFLVVYTYSTLAPLAREGGCKFL